MFERFHRIEGRAARTHEGSGIGLALVHELVALHGGTVDVAASLGEGTAFTVRLPLGHGAPAADGSRRLSAPCAVRAGAPGAAPYVEEALRWLPPRAPADADPAAATPTARRRPRILVADDNADMRDYSPAALATLAGRDGRRRRGRARGASRAQRRTSSSATS